MHEALARENRELRKQVEELQAVLKGLVIRDDIPLFIRDDLRALLAKIAVYWV